MFHCFLQLPLQGALVVFIRLPRAMPWAMEEIGLSARQPDSPFLYKHWTECSCLHHSKYRMSRIYAVRSPNRITPAIYK